jgi:hypothetical protein
LVLNNNSKLAKNAQKIADQEKKRKKRNKVSAIVLLFIDTHKRFNLVYCKSKKAKTMMTMTTMRKRRTMLCR